MVRARRSDSGPSFGRETESKRANAVLRHDSQPLGPRLGRRPPLLQLVIIEDWLIPAIINDFKKNVKAGQESNGARVSVMRASWISLTDWDFS